MKCILFFIIGFVLAMAISFVKRKCQKRQKKVENNPEKKFGATKLIIFSIMITYWIAFAVGVWVVVAKDVYQLSVLLTFVGSVTAFAVAFYCWKAKAENLLKIKASNPELNGCLTDFSNMASQ